MWFARATPIATAVPVLGVCLDLTAGCLIALGLLGMTATAKLTGLLYLVRRRPRLTSCALLSPLVTSAVSLSVSLVLA